MFCPAHRKWKAQQEEMLQEKDAAELASLDELRALAQKELQEWYAHYDDQLKHTKDSNRLVTLVLAGSIKGYCKNVAT